MAFVQAVIDFISITIIGGIISFFTSKWTRKKVLATVLVVVAIAWLFTRGGGPVEETTEAGAPEVTVSQVGSLAGGGAFAVTGSVEALAEAQLKAEAGGRVTSVTTEIGKFVPAGMVIATFDNASERAALLQAQGAYESAQAAARQSTLGVDEANSALEAANRNAVTAVSSAYNTAAGVVQTDIDIYFSNPNGQIPGLRINGYSETLSINAARVSLQTTLANWQRESLALGANDNLDRAVENSRRYVGEVIALTDSLITALSKDNDGGAAGAAERAGQIDRLTAARGSLLGVQSSLQGTLSSLDAARDAKSRAEINATNGSGPSTAGAQLTSALGSLRAAQAQYEKTLVRTPISGVVNALYIKNGDFVPPSADVAIIANNAGKQVSAAINESDRNLIAVGDIVTFDETATGTLTAIAGAVDPKTGKVAIKMSVSTPELLTTGTNVSVAFTDQVATSSDETVPLAIPLTAIKLMADGAVVYVVNNESKLEARKITLGRVLGDTIVVTEGIDKSTSIVVDARGRKAGELVVVKQ